AANLGDGIQATCVAKSGFYAGEALLQGDKNSFDSLKEDWAGSEELSVGSAAFFDAGRFELNIEDESGRIPINKLIKESNEYNAGIKNLLTRFLTLPEFDMDEQQVRDIVDAVRDWIDEDDEITGFGAENIYYEGLEEPYACKNAPLDCIDELLMVKGITEDLYYGRGERPGIARYLTVHGEGKININTAPNLVLMALADGITGEMVSSMDEYRRDEENDLSGPNWYKKITGMDGIDIDSKLITAKSNIFSITSTGYLNDISRSVRGTVERGSDGGAVKILSWKVD
ncbi:MAG: general secretion pathway protein GspK, partial [Deltaproteobacteria bacterium]|nr:general secretion pathway protein GspK [Deltaproteobacteria bacterium]